MRFITRLTRKPDGMIEMDVNYGHIKLALLTPEQAENLSLWLHQMAQRGKDEMHYYYHFPEYQPPKFIEGNDDAFPEKTNDV